MTSVTSPAGILRLGKGSVKTSTPLIAGILTTSAPKSWQKGIVAYEVATRSFPLNKLVIRVCTLLAWDNFSAIANVSAIYRAESCELGEVRAFTILETLLGYESLPC